MPIDTEHDPWPMIWPFEPTWLNPNARRWMVVNDRGGVGSGGPGGSPLGGVIGSGFHQTENPLDGSSRTLGGPTNAANPTSPAVGGFDFGDLSFLFGAPRSQQQNGMGDLFNLLLSLGLSQSGNADLSGLYSGIEV